MILVYFNEYYVFNQTQLQSLVDKSAVNNPMLRDNPTLCGTNRLALTSTSASQHARHHHDTALPLTTDLLIGAQTGAVWPRASQTRTAARVARTRLVRTCIGHAYPAFCGVFDRTSQRMITGADDKLVKVRSFERKKNKQCVVFNIELIVFVV